MSDNPGKVLRRLTPVILVLLLAAGCAVRKRAYQTYRLVTGPLLIPPGVGAADVQMRVFTSQVAAGPARCPSANDVVTVEVRRKKLKVTVRKDALAAQKPGWLSEWAGRMEAQGCVASGEGMRLADEVVEAVPLHPMTAFRLRYASEVELGPQIRIQVVSPILRDGTKPEELLTATETKAAGAGLVVDAKASDNLLGFETAWYSVLWKTGLDGFRIEPISAERHIKGQTEQRAQPEKNYFRFPDDARFYRLFYKEEQTEFTALMVAGVTRTELDERTVSLATGRASCLTVKAGWCVAIPKALAVNLFLPVMVHGKEVMVQWGANVGEAIRESGERRAESVLPSLTVSKPYGGRPAPVEFDRNGNAILGLVLVGGETINW
jgi:hypothetical protein